MWGQKTWTPEILAKLREPGEPLEPSPPPATLAIVIPPNLERRLDDTRPEVVSAWLNRDSTLDAGGVVLLVVIGEDGIPRNARVVQGPGTDLDARAIEAVRQWHFQPALLNGTPVSSTATIELDFRFEMSHAADSSERQTSF